MRFDLPTMDEIRSSAGESAAGVPMQVPVDDIDEDPEQPRQEFDRESLAELAATIAGRGVRQPVSVRRHPQRSGRWVLNFGARRLRAAKLAGESTIAAFEDASADSYDQVIENEQREGLKPLEIALFVKKRLDLGERQADIARRLGKSQPYVTYACSLIDPPDWLLDLYRTGKCRGLFELHELRRLHESNARAVEAALAAVEHFGRAELKLLKARISSAGPRPPPLAERVRTEAPEGLGTSAAAVLKGPVELSPSGSERAPSLSPPVAFTRRAVLPLGGVHGESATQHADAAHTVAVKAMHAGAWVRVVLDEVPDRSGSIWVVTDDGTRTVAAIDALDRLQLLINCVALHI
jgi:ParB family chromosome partitioning protein